MGVPRTLHTRGVWLQNLLQNLPRVICRSSSNQFVKRILVNFRAYRSPAKFRHANYFTNTTVVINHEILLRESTQTDFCEILLREILLGEILHCESTRTDFPVHLLVHLVRMLHYSPLLFKAYPALVAIC